MVTEFTFFTHRSSPQGERTAMFVPAVKWRMAFKFHFDPLANLQPQDCRITNLKLHPMLVARLRLSRKEIKHRLEICAGDPSFVDPGSDIQLFGGFPSLPQLLFSSTTMLAKKLGSNFAKSRTKPWHRLGWYPNWWLHALGNMWAWEICGIPYQTFGYWDSSSLVCENQFLIRVVKGLTQTSEQIAWKLLWVGLASFQIASTMDSPFPFVVRVGNHHLTILQLRFDLVLEQIFHLAVTLVSWQADAWYLVFYSFYRSVWMRGIMLLSFWNPNK